MRVLNLCEFFGKRLLQSTEKADWWLAVMAKPGVMFYFDIRPCIKRLNDDEKGRLFDAILDYGENGAEPDLDGVLGIAWDFIKPRLDIDTERYEMRILQKQYAAFVREAKKQGSASISFDEWKDMPDVERDRVISGDVGRYPTTYSESTSNTNIDNMADKPPRAARFTPPSLAEVRAYCTERGNSVDAERFVDFYASKGWLIGKSRMKDWRAAVRSWERSDERHGASTKDRVRSYEQDASFV